MSSRLDDFLLQEGFNKKTHEFFLHGTSSRTLNKLDGDFDLTPGKKFFTTVDPETAAIFAERTVSKQGGGALDGVVLAIPKDSVKILEQRKLILTKPIDDMPTRREIIFQPGADDLIFRLEGEFVRLPSDFFKP